MNTLKILIISTGLGIMPSFSLFGQVLHLDTIIVTSIQKEYRAKADFTIHNDSVYLNISLEKNNSTINFIQNVQSGKFENHNFQEKVSWMMYSQLYKGNTVILGSPSEHYLVDLVSGSFKDISSIPLYKDLIITDYYTVTLETYPDFDHPKQEVKLKYGTSLEDNENYMILPFDFPHYLAKPHHLFDVKDSTLCYCNTTKYSCFLVNLNTGERTQIIADTLNDSSFDYSIEQFRKSIFKGSPQPKKWIPELTAFDDSITRISKVFFDEDQIVVLKKPPFSKFDFRYLDKFELKDNHWVKVVSDFLVQVYPDSISYANPFFPVTYSPPVLFYKNKFYVFSPSDYSEGFKNGITKEEFLKAKDKYYEVNDNYYTVYVYTLE